MPDVLRNLRLAKKNYLKNQGILKQQGGDAAISYSGLYHDSEVQAALRAVNEDMAFAKQLNLGIQIRLKLDQFPEIK